MTQELAENDAPRGIFITFEGGEGAGKPQGAPEGK